MPSKKPKSYRLNLALQGGGAHGAFTWGVLDRLLEEEDIDLIGVAGTSAGAINAAMLADGMARGGRAGARKQLRTFWERTAQVGLVFTPWTQSPHQTSGWFGMFNPLNLMPQQSFSPYDTNPLNLNPLRDILEELLDSRHLQGPLKLFITATHVESGQAKIFQRDEVTVDALLASACLPFLFQAVEIEGAPYWDGGYMGNPSIWPLFYNTDCDDVLLVQLNPLCRVGTPKSAGDIMNRLNEITFNASLIAEMRAIQFVKKLIDSGKLDQRQYKNIHMHLVHPESDLPCMTANTKLEVNMTFFEHLFNAGRDSMEQWLQKHKTSIGVKATLDIERGFLTKKPRVNCTAHTVD